VVIIGKTMADRLFNGRSAVGRRLRYSSIEAPPMTIVGVVGDVKITGLDQELRPVIYFPFRQNSSIFSNLVIRTTTEPTVLAASVRREIQTLEPQAAVFNVQAMPELISATPAAFMRRFPATLMGVFAGLACCWPRLESTASFPIPWSSRLTTSGCVWRWVLAAQTSSGSCSGRVSYSPRWGLESAWPRRSD
jgi:hypothetical protein